VVRGDWHHAVEVQAAELHAALGMALARKVDLLVARHGRLHEAAPARPDIVAWIETRALDDAVAAAEALLDLGAPPKNADAALSLAWEAVQHVPGDGAVLRARAALLSLIGARPALTDPAQEALAGLRAVDWAHVVSRSRR
jgi:hypothetical protein